MEVILYIILFSVGIIMGSFYNVVIFRVPEKNSIILPRSSCLSCRTILKPLDLIPVFSYLFLKGKCRYCNASLSIQYPITEFLTGVMFVALYLKFGVTIELFFSIYMMSILLMVFFIDLKHMIIPNELVLAGLAGGFAFFIVRFFYIDVIMGEAAWYSPLLGMISASGILLLVAFLGMMIYKGDAMGMGDVKIFLPIGLFLGLKLSILTLVFSIFIGGLTGLILMITRLKNRKSQIPFGPFIVAGTFLSLFYGQEILMWYLGRF